MAWIRTVPPDRATGLLERIYDEAFRRAGKVYQILRIQSLRPRTLQLSTQLYIDLMYSPHGRLTRAQREMIATAASRANACDY